MYYSTPSLISTGQINARDTGITLTIDPKVAGNIETLTGSTCALVVTYILPIKRRLVLPFLVSQDGTVATRVTQSTDFPIAGQCEVQFVVATQSGSFSSAVFGMIIGPRI